MLQDPKVSVRGSTRMHTHSYSPEESPHITYLIDLDVPGPSLWIDDAKLIWANFGHRRSTSLFMRIQRLAPDVNAHGDGSRCRWSLPLQRQRRHGAYSDLPRRSHSQTGWAYAHASRAQFSSVLRRPGLVFSRVSRVIVTNDSGVKQ